MVRLHRAVKCLEMTYGALLYKESEINWSLMHQRFVSLRNLYLSLILVTPVSFLLQLLCVFYTCITQTCFTLSSPWHGSQWSLEGFTSRRNDISTKHCRSQIVWNITNMLNTWELNYSVFLLAFPSCYFYYTNITELTNQQKYNKKMVADYTECMFLFSVVTREAHWTCTQMLLETMVIASKSPDASCFQ